MRELVLKRLEELNISYKEVKHPPVYTIEDMDKLGKELFENAKICKNLFLRDQKGKRHFLVVLCSEKKADMAKIQEQALSTRLSFASSERLMKYLKLEAGHVSPMGLINDEEKKVEVLIDKDLKNKSLLAVHPNTNEASILITYEDLMKFINAMGNEYEFITI